MGSKDQRSKFIPASEVGTQILPNGQIALLMAVDSGRVVVAPMDEANIKSLIRELNDKLKEAKKDKEEPGYERVRRRKL